MEDDVLKLKEVVSVTFDTTPITFALLEHKAYLHQQTAKNWMRLSKSQKKLQNCQNLLRLL